MNFNESQFHNPVLSRISVTYYFFLLGVLSGNWIVRIPDLQTKFLLSKGDLGILLTGAPIGAILITLVVGKWIDIYGSKTMTIIGALAYHIILATLFFLPNPFVLWLFLILIGFSGTILDISINSQGVEIEKLLKTSIMSSLHAFFSIGAMIGVLIGAIFVSFGISPAIHLLTVSIIFFPFSLFFIVFLSKEKLVTNNKKIRRVSNWEIFSSKEILILGSIAFIAIIGEAMMGDWSLIYILANTNVTKSFAAFGFAIFSLFMTIGRISGDSVLNKFSPKTTVKMFSFIGGGGLIISILTNNIFVIFIGFALLGLGISTLIPIVFKLAGNHSFIEIGSGIAGVSFFSYLSTVVEPVFIGQLADAFSLKIAFFVVAVLISFIILISNDVEKFNLKSTS